MAKRFDLKSCTLDVANAFITRHHRHAGRVQAAMFSCTLSDRPAGNIIGVGVLGRPLSRLLDDGVTLEVRRIATDGTMHACSAIYGGLLRAARFRGALRAVTYTRESEAGSSLRAVGFRLDIAFHRDFDVVGTRIVPKVVPKPARSWSSPSRPRVDAKLGEARFRWWYITPAGQTEDGAMRLGAAASRAGQVNGCPFAADDWRWRPWRDGFNYPNWEDVAA